MSEKVKRWFPYCEYGTADMEEHDLGDYVLFGDCAELVTALRGMLDLWAREWDHEGGSAMPEEVEVVHEVLAKHEEV